ncbi:MAG: hypothetical protein N4A35_02460 [Flavobacteriales bacterium]|jgi:hypothetical protein|nr:hypothetical protein [Flavobacteriales bacterium]
MKKIIYKNQKNEVIKEVDLPTDDYYAEPAEVKGAYQKKEVYKNGALVEFEVFMERDQKHSEILNNPSLKGVQISIGTRQTIGELRYEKVYCYESTKVLSTIFNTVFDKENQVIVSSFTDDIENEVPYWNGTTKYYYDSSIREGDALFECQYNDDGELIPITIDVEELGLGDHDGTWIYNDAEGVADLMRIFKMPHSLAAFYVSSVIVPPETAIEK